MRHRPVLVESRLNSVENARLAEVTQNVVQVGLPESGQALSEFGRLRPKLGRCQKEVGGFLAQLGRL